MKEKKQQEIDMTAWAVDASCLGNPGIMEYRGIEIGTREEIFRMRPFEDGTNNVGEYLAIVHAMSLMVKNNDYHTIYTDSMTAMNWMHKKRHNSKLKPTSKNGYLFELLSQADKWLKDNTFNYPILKWQTDKWGEIPADFGRK